MLSDLETPLNSALEAISRTVGILEDLHTELAASAPIDYEGYLNFLREDPIGQQEAIGLSWLKPRMQEGFDSVDDFVTFLSDQNYSAFEIALRRLSDQITHYVKSNYPHYDPKYVDYLDSQRKFLIECIGLLHPQHSARVAFSNVGEGDFFDRRSMIAVPEAARGKVRHVYAQGIPRLTTGNKAIVHVK